MNEKTKNRADDTMPQVSDTHRIRGGYPPARRSLYSRIFEQHPNVMRVVVAGAAIGAAAFVLRRAGFSTGDWPGRRSARLASLDE